MFNVPSIVRFIYYVRYFLIILFGTLAVKTAYELQHVVLFYINEAKLPNIENVNVTIAVNKSYQTIAVSDIPSETRKLVSQSIRVNAQKFTQKSVEVFKPESVNTQYQFKKQKQACIHPKLEENDPTMMRFYRKISTTTCKEYDWVYVNNGTLYFIDSVRNNQHLVSCNYTEIIRTNEKLNTFGSPIINISIPFNIQHNAFKITCANKDGKRYENILQGVAFKEEYVNRKQDPLKEGFGGMSIAIFGLDSMSRMSWHRRLPITRKYMLDEMNAIELQQHNIVGDGTTAVMLPMLTGKFEWELPECRVKVEGAKPMDDFPWIWHDFKKAGYLTSWSNARPDTAPFNWRMLGFKNKPTDFYPRTFYVSIWRHLQNFHYNCWGSQSRPNLWLKWFKDIFLMYKNQRKFLFHFITDMTHDNNNLVTEMDKPIQAMLQHLHEDGYLNNTLLILMGDHGARYHTVRYTVSGKLEERLPYFSFVFPKWFYKRYPDAIKNLKINTKRLTTPFDIHETFKQFFKYTGAEKGNVFSRGISLFNEVPQERTCQHADISSHWCACLDWIQTNISVPSTAKALQTALDTINGYISDYRNDCALLSIDKVTMATKMEKFKRANVIGSFHNVNASSKLNSDKTLYQLTFSTSPGGGVFEVTVTHNLTNNKYSLSEKEISRINKYGNAPHCILSKNRQIRAFCYCRDLIKS